jgi:hypothetical protein
MAEKIQLAKSYSKLHESLIKLFDESGVRRSFTVPYVDGQDMHEHIQTVGQAAAQAGGMTKNLLTTAHHSTGKGWGSGDGHTVAHPADQLRNTVIPSDDKNAKAVISAAQSHINNLGKLLGDDNPEIVKANSQLDLVKQNNGAGMNLMDMGVMMIHLMHPPTQAVVKAVSKAHSDGHAPQARFLGQAPSQNAQESQGSAPGEAQAAGTAPEGQEAPAAHQGAPEAAQAA